MALAPSSALARSPQISRQPHGLPRCSTMSVSPASRFPPFWVGAVFAPASWARSCFSSGADDAATSGGRYPVCGFRPPSIPSAASAIKKRSFMVQDAVIPKASPSEISPPDGGDGITSDFFESWEVEASSQGTSFLAKLAIALGIAATLTVLSISFKGTMPGPSCRLPFSFGGSSSSFSSGSTAGFTCSIFGYKVILPEYTPGWVYFWLLMAAGCGLFISEEALNVWVGISLARTLSLDGTWKSFVHSFSMNGPYILSTVLWVYWGVCISDMIPFYLGKLFRQTKASANICSKLGIGKDKVVSITRAVQNYGNMIGFVERFSVGVRNPTAFLAGAWGIPSDCFFAGVCFGGLVTLPIQLGIGFLLRERPMMALAGVATAVGIWTVFPYILAASAALYLYARQHLSN